MGINKHKTGLVVGSFTAFLHVLWSFLVAFGLGQPLLNFIYQLHFLNNPFTVASFLFKQATMLIVIAAIWGYIIGWIFGFIFNRIHTNL